MFSDITEHSKLGRCIIPRLLLWDTSGPQTAVLQATILYFLNLLYCNCTRIFSYLLWKSTYSICEEFSYIYSTVPSVLIIFCNSNNFSSFVKILWTTAARNRVLNSLSVLCSMQYRVYRDIRAYQVYKGSLSYLSI